MGDLEQGKQFLYYQARLFGLSEEVTRSILAIKTLEEMYVCAEFIFDYATEAVKVRKEKANVYDEWAGH